MEKKKKIKHDMCVGYYGCLPFKQLSDGELS